MKLNVYAQHSDLGMRLWLSKRDHVGIDLHPIRNILGLGIHRSSCVWALGLGILTIWRVNLDWKDRVNG